MPEEQQERLAAWLTSQLARGFKPAERAVFAALAELERPMQSMADMPDADAVARQAKQTAQEFLTLGNWKQTSFKTEKGHGIGRRSSKRIFWKEAKPTMMAG